MIKIDISLCIEANDISALHVVQDAMHEFVNTQNESKIRVVSARWSSREQLIDLAPTLTHSE
jgi:hypothetical protein